MKNRTILNGLAGLVLAFFFLAGVGWADDYGDRHRGRHGEYKGDRYHDKRDHKRHDKWKHGRYKSHVDKDYRHDRHLRKHKVRPHHRKHPGKREYHYHEHFHAKPYYRVPRHQSAFTFGTSFFDPNFFFGFSVRDTH